MRSRSTSVRWLEPRGDERVDRHCPVNLLFRLHTGRCKRLDLSVECSLTIL